MGLSHCPSLLHLHTLARSAKRLRAIPLPMLHFVHLMTLPWPTFMGSFRRHPLHAALRTITGQLASLLLPVGQRPFCKRTTIAQVAPISTLPCPQPCHPLPGLNDPGPSSGSRDLKRVVLPRRLSSSCSLLLKQLSVGLKRPNPLLQLTRASLRVARRAAILPKQNGRSTCLA